MTANMEKVANLMESKNYEQAFTLVNTIIQQEPTSINAYLQKSVIARRLNRFQESLDSSEKAVILAHKIGRSLELGQAQLNRAIGLYHLGQFGNANFAIQLSKKVNKDSLPTLEIWEMKLTPKLESATDEEARVTISEIPSIKGFPIDHNPNTAPDNVSSISPDVAPTTDVRFDYYQNAQLMNVSLFIKNVPKDTAKITFSPTSVSLLYIDSSGTEHGYLYEPLYDTIVPEESSYRIFGTKVELYLKKSHAHVTWNSLLANGSGPEIAQSKRENVNEPKPTSTFSNDSSKTTSRIVKDWDKINLSDDEDDQQGGDPTKLFQQIYKDADDDTKRAMMKSYIESNGTALSTNWSSVGKKRVEIDPPSEMQAKKW
ncbi:SGS-domain-containing protein [Nadsonia fulvescens var. elongata DSM 6958]|uniref:SGS-domain-containing protein n=1 Tax=Nadsonia fulvescens var. elongata DSM 6958 TaxID=857566 RepID=A0A1E3PPA4_9ASCO|nr:SGS-domain-containing protein [Nadsonia fulvescens var. elongata DSM 6958]